MALSNIIKTLATVVTPLQELEDTYQELLTAWNIYDASGVRIDGLGKLVGEPDRNGEDDDTYRRRVFARISVNNSSGILEQLITISKLILNDDTAYIHLVRQEPATIVVRIEEAPVTDAVAAILIAFLRQAAAGGVRLILEYFTVAPEDLFRFDVGPGFDVGVLATATV